MAEGAPAVFHPSLGQPGCDVVYYATPLTPAARALALAAEHPPPSDPSASNSGSSPSFTVAVPPATLPHIFAHRQWRAGMILADLIAGGHVQPWIQGKTVLELGCGTALPALVAAHPRLGRAGVVLATDYDEPELVRTLKGNVSRAAAQHGLDGRTQLRAAGYTWGTSPDDIFDLLPSSLLASRRASITPPQEAGKFDAILLADTLWDSLSHSDLAKSLGLTLARTAQARVLVAAGLHTGRERIGEFVKKAERVGLEVVSLSEASPGGSASIWNALGLIPEPELERVLEGSSHEERAMDAWTASVLEFELALEPDEEAQDAVPSRAEANPTSSERYVIESRGPRMTGRRRRFVAHEALRLDEAKERGGVKLRNRWMTLWALQWKKSALS